MMFKVMIVDDEPAIREGLKTIINWNEIGFEVVDAAVNGRDALQKFERWKPDLTIMDIRMPGMSGLEVIEQIRQQYHSAHFLILSGHADFEYARKALGYGVDGYLLKPVDEDEMQDELRRVHGSLHREQQDMIIHTLETPLYEKVEQVLVHSSAQDQDAYWLDLKWERYQVILLEFRHLQGDESTNYFADLQKFTELSSNSDHWLVFRAGNYIGILTNHPYIQAYELKQLRESIWSLLHAQPEIYLAASEVVTTLTDLRYCYEEALSLIGQRFWFDDNGVLSKELAPTSQVEPVTEAPLAGEWSDRLYYAVDIRSLSAAERVLDELCHMCWQARLSEREVKSLCSHVLSLALSRLPASVPGSGSAVQQCLSLIPELYAVSTTGQMIQLVVDRLEQLLQSINHGTHESVMKQMTDFIQRNYSDNLKLELLAEIFNYNSAYLGKMFKTHTGESFNHFLDQVRLDQAKALLAQGMKVHKVASQVGYANVDYFHSKFKKYTGISPSAYRDQESSHS